jgi:hypothetical protein
VVVTDNLYLAGLALTRGGELRGVSVRGTNGRRIAVFAIDGPDVAAAEREYFAGRTLVDLRLLQLEVRRLKDAAFGALRAEEQEEKSHAGDQVRNRADQGRERAFGGRR